MEVWTDIAGIALPPTFQQHPCHHFTCPQPKQGTHLPAGHPESRVKHPVTTHRCPVGSFPPTECSEDRYRQETVHLTGQDEPWRHTPGCPRHPVQRTLEDVLIGRGERLAFPQDGPHRREDVSTCPSGTPVLGSHSPEAPLCVPGWHPGHRHRILDSHTSYSGLPVAQAPGTLWGRLSVHGLHAPGGPVSDGDSSVSFP